jgi:hypothetical protein
VGVVGVHDHDDVLGRRGGEHRAQSGVDGLPQAEVHPMAHQSHVQPGDTGTRRVRRGVRRPVIDHPHGEVLIPGEHGESPQQGRQRRRLVVGGQHHVRATGGRLRRRHGTRLRLFD